jgi:hypothetical protein
MESFNREQSLLDILVSYAPDLKAQNTVFDTYNRMVENEETTEVIEKQIIGALNDGVTHGNWPWVNYWS